MRESPSVSVARTSCCAALPLTLSSSPGRGPRRNGGSPVGVFATEFWRRRLMPVTCSRINLHFPVARGRALVFPARMPDLHRLPFAIVFGPRVVRYRLNTHFPVRIIFPAVVRRGATGDEAQDPTSALISSYIFQVQVAWAAHSFTCACAGLSPIVVRPRVLPYRR